jgi:5,10-methylenetetrahydromethanopterin reductase
VHLGKIRDMTLSVGVAIDGHESLSAVLPRLVALDRGDAIDTLWIADERFRRDVWTSMGAIGASTNRLRLATCVTDPFVRHPALTGAAIATVDDVAPGRAILGLGAGASGFAAMGNRRERPAVALRETIGFLRQFWTADEAFSYEGSSVQFRDARLGFRPADDRGNARPIPIMLAGRGPLILELAGQLADGVLVATFLDGPLLEASLARVAAGEARRAESLAPLRRVSWCYVAIDDDGEAARDAVRRGIAVAIWGSRPIIEELGVPLPTALRQLMDERAYSIEPETIGLAAALIPDDLVDACSIAGPPAEVATRLHGLSARGFAEAACWLFDTPNVGQGRMVERLAHEVVPGLRALERGI